MKIGNMTSRTIALCLLAGLLFVSSEVLATEVRSVKAVYLTSSTVRSDKKMQNIEKIIDNTEVNAVVIDVKVDKPAIDAKLKKIVSRFNQRGVWTIARIAVMQDSWLAMRRPDLAIKKSNGDFWYSGKKSWKRYWVDPASKEVADYNANIAKQAIDAGFREIQFDYIRFPSDGNLRDMVYPIYKKQSKYEVMDRFFARLTGEVRRYDPKIVIGIDIFGEAFFNGAEPGVGQRMSDIEKYFDVVSPMNYPSHFCCGEFGFCDPNQHPYAVMSKSLSLGERYLKNKNIIIRPWVQVFSIRNIYNCKCGMDKVNYGKEEVKDQIRAICDVGHTGWMLWNGSSKYNNDVLAAALSEKNKPPQ